MKETYFKYLIDDEIDGRCQQRLGACFLDNDKVKFSLCQLEMEVSSLSAIEHFYNIKKLKLILEKKLISKNFSTIL